MQHKDNIQLSLFGKMSSEPSAQTTETTFGQYSTQSEESQKISFARLDLRSGHTPGKFWLTDSVLLTAPSIYSTGVAPRCVVACSLWQILEDNVQEKYYLSGKACRGILRRSEKKGKKLHFCCNDSKSKRYRWGKDCSIG